MKPIGKRAAAAVVALTMLGTTLAMSSSAGAGTHYAMDTMCKRNFIALNAGAAIGVLGGGGGGLNLDYTVYGFCGSYELGADLDGDGLPDEPPTYDGPSTEALLGAVDGNGDPVVLDRDAEFVAYQNRLIEMHDKVIVDFGSPAMPTDPSHPSYNDLVNYYEGVHELADNVAANLDLINHSLNGRLPTEFTAYEYANSWTWWHGYYSLSTDFTRNDDPATNVHKSLLLGGYYNDILNTGGSSWMGDGVGAVVGDGVLGAGCATGSVYGINGSLDDNFVGSFRAGGGSACAIGGGNAQEAGIGFAGLAWEYVASVYGA